MNALTLTRCGNGRLLKDRSLICSSILPISTLGEIIRGLFYQYPHLPLSSASFSINTSRTIRRPQDTVDVFYSVFHGNIT